MGGGGCVYAPVASLPCKICSVLLKSVDRPAWLTTANSFSELNPDQIIFLWLPLYCDNRDGFEYYTTRQLQYTIRSGFFFTYTVMLEAKKSLRKMNVNGGIIIHY